MIKIYFKLVILLLVAFSISCNEVKKASVEDNKSKEFKEKNSNSGKEN
ncbi:MAG: hypothetical protein IPN57_04090 [Ignavibacteria bacterium]|nr:hypothetical protein [Ignavibacteria bacterium]